MALMSITLSTAIGLFGAALMIASYLMTSMLPLRLVALSACCVLVIYGAVAQTLPTLLLYGVLMPINAKKAWRVHRLVRAIERARMDSPLAEWLLPHMTRRVAAEGQMLWQKGDIATEMIYVESGQLRLVEYGELLGPGALVGEIGLLSPDNRRTLSVRCETDCVLHSLSAEGLAQLYYTNPKLGFHVLKLIVQRLTHDADLARRAAHTRDLPGADVSGAA